MSIQVGVLITPSAFGLSVVMLSVVILNVAASISCIKTGLIYWQTSCSANTDDVKAFSICGKCFKTLYCRKLSLFIKSYSVCPWQGFPAQSSLCGFIQEPTLEWSIRVGSGLTRKHQTKLKRPNAIACYEKGVTCGRKMFYNIGPWTQSNTTLYMTYTFVR